MVNISLAAAAVLVVATGIAHSWLGERRIVGPIFSPERRAKVLESRFIRQVLRFAWHITTLAWWGIAAIVGVVAVSPIDSQSRAILAVVTVLFFVSGMVTLLASRSRHLAWLAFFAIAALCALPAVQS